MVRRTHQPCEQPGEAHRSTAGEWHGQFGASSLMTHDAQLSKGIEMEGLWTMPGQLSTNVLRQRFRLAQRELGGRRTRLAGSCIVHRSAIAECPNPGMTWHGHHAIHDHSSPLILLDG